jgi:hypothetical protein
LTCHFLFSSGAGRDRTDDLRLAKPALSQLSYSPVELLRDFFLLMNVGYR